MQRLWRPDELRELDRCTIEDVGVPAIALMERAGAEAARVILELFPDARRPRILVGSGNNGGDGYVIARHLHDAGLEPRLQAIGAPATLEAQTMARAAERLGIASGADDGQADLVVDAVFGTGFSGTPDDTTARELASAMARGVPVVSIDIPSGVSGATGEVPGAAIGATLTIALHGRTLGTAIEPGRGRAGEVVVVPIGLTLASSVATAWLMERVDLGSLPARGAAGTKYDAGSVLVVGGSEGMSGAPALAARAAMRAGAGLVWACVPDAVVEAVAAHTPEVMVCGLERTFELAARAGSVICGPGLGRDAHVAPLVERLLAEVAAPLLLDADALFGLGGRLTVLARRAHPTVLTPHAGELARLLGVERAEVERARLASVEAASSQAAVCVLLKGPDTLVVAPGEALRVVETAVPQLATAGAGDVLSGAIGALLARGLSPVEAASLGALAHGLAAGEAQELTGTLLASDLEGPLARLLA